MRRVTTLIVTGTALAVLLFLPAWAETGPVDPIEQFAGAPRSGVRESVIHLDGWTAPLDASVNPMDVKWDDRFWVGGIQGRVNTLVEYNGDLIAGGGFTYVEGQPRYFVARWDGSQWHAMGDGLSATVLKLHVFDGKVYAIGRFNQVMQWDGFSWSVAVALPPLYVTDPEPYHSITDYDGSLVVGTYRGVYRLVDGAWESLGSMTFWLQYSPRINALLVDGGYLYAGGNLLSAAGVPVRGVARWNGSVWEALGQGVNGMVYDLAAHDGMILALGKFDTAGVTPVHNIAGWNGTDWNAYTTGTTSSNDYVVTHCNFGGELVVAGYFVTAGSDTVYSIARWDGTAWQSFDQSLTYAWISSLIVYNGELYAGGNYVNKGARRVHYLGRWSGTEWVPTAAPPGGKGLYGAVRDFAVHQGILLAGGSLTGCDDGALGSLAAFDGADWSSFSGGIGDIYVSVLGEYNGDVVVGGAFGTINGVPATCVATWDGVSWIPLATEVMTTPGGATEVCDVIEYDGKLIVAGWAKGFDGVEAIGVAQWDGTSWSRLGDGLADCGAWSSRVYDLEVYNGELYIGGYFGAYSTCGPGPKHLAKWDGTELTQVADLDGSVSKMTVFNGDLIITGGFQHINGQPISQFARWDGTQWHQFGAELTQEPDGGPGIDDMVVYNGELVVGGWYYKKYSWGSQAQPLFARWDGMSWRSLGSGIGSGVYVSALEEWNGQLAVGGMFSEMGGKPANYISIWNGGGPCCVFRGDLNNTGTVEVADLTFLVNALFRGGQGASCFEHSDLDASGQSNVSDLTDLVNYLFKGGAEPSPCPVH